MRQGITILAVLLISAAVSVSQSKTGTSVGQFLLIEPSARIAAMGNAGSTAYGDIQSAYYNPAAIGLLSTNGVQFTHSPWIADISYNFAALGISLAEAGNIYASVTSLNSGDIAVRTVEQPLGTGEQYSVNDLAFGLGYGRRISDRFSVGVQVTYLQETIWHSVLSAFAMNVGTVYRISAEGLHIGASISNFGTRTRFDGSDLRILFDQNSSSHGDNGTIPAEISTDTYPLPILFRVGLGVPVRVNDDNVVNVAVDAFHPSDNNESVSMGAEWAYNNTLFLRGGYQNLFLQDSEVGLTLGAGVLYTLDVYSVCFDYSWADQGRLKEAHRFTLGISF
jgi:long-subunit fatty acid transport protein